MIKKYFICLVLIFSLILGLSEVCFAIVNDGNPGQGEGQSPKYNVQYYSAQWDRYRRDATEQFVGGQQLTDSVTFIETPEFVKFKVNSKMATHTIAYNVLYNQMMLHTQDYDGNVGRIGKYITMPIIYDTGVEYEDGTSDDVFKASKKSISNNLKSLGVIELTGAVKTDHECIESPVYNNTIPGFRLNMFLSAPIRVVRRAADGTRSVIAGPFRNLDQIKNAQAWARPQDLDSYFDMGFDFNLEAYPVEVYVLKYSNSALGPPQRVSLGPDGKYYIPGSVVGFTFPSTYQGLNYVKGLYGFGSSRTTPIAFPSDIDDINTIEGIRYFSSSVRAPGLTFYAIYSDGSHNPPPAVPVIPNGGISLTIPESNLTKYYGTLGNQALKTTATPNGSPSGYSHTYSSHDTWWDSTLLDWVSGSRDHSCSVSYSAKSSSLSVNLDLGTLMTTPGQTIRNNSATGYSSNSLTVNPDTNLVLRRSSFGDTPVIAAWKNPSASTMSALSGFGFSQGYKPNNTQRKKTNVNQSYTITQTATASRSYSKSHGSCSISNSTVDADYTITSNSLVVNMTAEVLRASGNTVPSTATASSGWLNANLYRIVDPLGDVSFYPEYVMLYDTLTSQNNGVYVVGDSLRSVPALAVHDISLRNKGALSLNSVFSIDKRAKELQTRLGVDYPVVPGGSFYSLTASSGARVTIRTYGLRINPTYAAYWGMPAGDDIKAEHEHVVNSLRTDMIASRFGLYNYGSSPGGVNVNSQTDSEGRVLDTFFTGKYFADFETDVGNLSATTEKIYDLGYAGSLMSTPAMPADIDSALRISTSLSSALQRGAGTNGWYNEECSALQVVEYITEFTTTAKSVQGILNPKIGPATSASVGKQYSNGAIYKFEYRPLIKFDTLQGTRVEFALTGERNGFVKGVIISDNSVYDLGN